MGKTQAGMSMLLADSQNGNRVEFQCTQCGETVILRAEDNTPFKCASCGGEECEANFALD
jgi:hypothetical protein